MPDLNDIQREYERSGKALQQITDRATRFGQVASTLTDQVQAQVKTFQDAMKPAIDLAQLSKTIDPLCASLRLSEAMKPALDAAQLNKVLGASVGFGRMAQIMDAMSLRRQIEGLNFSSRLGITAPDLANARLGLGTGLDRPALSLPSTATRPRKSRRRPGRKKAAKPKVEAKPAPITVAVAESTAHTFVIQSQVVAPTPVVIPAPSRLEIAADLVKTPTVTVLATAVTGWLVLGNPFTWIAASIMGFCSLLFVYETMDLIVRKGKRPSTALKKALRRYFGLGKRKR